MTMIQGLQPHPFFAVAQVAARPARPSVAPVEASSSVADLAPDADQRRAIVPPPDPDRPTGPPPTFEANLLEAEQAKRRLPVSADQARADDAATARDPEEPGPEDISTRAEVRSAFFPEPVAVRPGPEPDRALDRVS